MKKKRRLLSSSKQPDTSRAPAQLPAPAPLPIQQTQNTMDPRLFALMQQQADNQTKMTELLADKFGKKDKEPNLNRYYQQEQAKLDAQIRMKFDITFEGAWKEERAKQKHTLLFIRSILLYVRTLSQVEAHDTEAVVRRITKSLTMI